mgnify:CR=1 FL=1
MTVPEDLPDFAELLVGFEEDRSYVRYVEAHLFYKPHVPAVAGQVVLEVLRNTQEVILEHAARSTTATKRGTIGWRFRE